MSDKVRAFLAIEIPPEVARKLADLKYRLAPELAGVRWVPAGNIHMTVKFLGDIVLPMTEAVSGVMSEMAGREPIRLEARGLGVFPGLKRPRVLWAGLDGETEALAGLAQELDERMERLGFRKESRKFHPHLTLGRFKPKAPVPSGLATLLRRVSDFGPLPFRAASLVLFKSDLRSGGPVYTPLSKVEFGT